MVAEGCLIPSQPSTKVNFQLTTVGNHPRQPTAAQQFDYLCTLLVRFGDKSRNELGRHGLQLIKSISTMHDIRMKAHSEFIGKSSATASTPTGNYNQPTETFAESTQSTTAAVSAAAATHQPMSTVRYTTNQGSSRRGIAPTGAANPDATIILWTDKPTAQIAESTEMATVIAVVKANRTQTRSSNPSHPTKPAVAADCGADNFRRLPTGSLLTAALYIQRDVAGEVQELPQWICECQSSQTPVKPDASQARCQLSRMPDEPDANEARCQSSQMPVKPDASQARCQSNQNAAVPDAAEPDAAEPDAAETDSIEPDAPEPDVAEPDAAVPDATVPECNVLKHDGGCNGCSRNCDADNHGSLDNRTLDGYLCDGGANSDGLLVNAQLLNIQPGGQLPCDRSLKNASAVGSGNHLTMEINMAQRVINQQGELVEAGLHGSNVLRHRHARGRRRRSSCFRRLRRNTQKRRRALGASSTHQHVQSTHATCRWPILSRGSGIRILSRGSGIRIQL